MKNIKINNQKAKMYNVIKSYYKVLDDLAARLQKDYAGDAPFEQDEEDRLAICFILDYFDDLKDEIKALRKERSGK